MTNRAYTSGDVESGAVIQSGLLVKNADGTYGNAGSGSPLPVSGSKVAMTVSFQREANATPYTAGDIVSSAAALTTPGMVFTNITRANGIGGYIVGARLFTDTKSVTPRFRVHLFSDNTATVSGDNLPARSLYAEISKRMGYFDLAAMITPADTSNSTQSATLDMSTLRFPFVPAAASRTIYAALEALDAFTPGSASNFSLTLIVELD